MSGLFPNMGNGGKGLPIPLSPRLTPPRGIVGYGKRFQRFLLSLPLPLPVRKAIAALSPSVWLLVLLGLGLWMFLMRSVMYPGGGQGMDGLGPRVREKDPRLKWLDEHYDQIAADPAHAGRGGAGAGKGDAAGQQQEPQRQQEQQAPHMPSGMEHAFGSDGLVRVGLEAFAHPVAEIVERAEAAWDRERARTVSDMSEWEEEYVDGNYGRNPPDAYRIWPLGHRRPPPLPPPFLLIFSALPEPALQRFQQEAEKLPDTFTLVFARGRVSVTVGAGDLDKWSPEAVERARGVEEIVKRFARDLPDMRVTISTAARPRQALPVSTTDILSSAHSSSQPLSSTYSDILFIPLLRSTPLATCPPPSTSTTSAPPLPGLTFLYWPREGLDPCRHAWLRDVQKDWFDPDLTVGAGGAGGAGGGLMAWAMPVLGFVGGAGASDLVVPPAWPMSSVQHDRGRGEWRPGDVPWANREAKLFWRGTLPPGGEIHPVHRLVQPAKRMPKLLVPRGRGFVLEERPNPLEGMLDVQFEQVPDWSRQANCKFALDLSISHEEHRFPSLLLSGALVFRSALFRTWASDNARAWVHYVPVLPDMSDLPALLHYFATHDGEARKIAEAGRRWAEDRQRMEDVAGAWFTTLVEYGRMYSKESDEDRYDY